MIRCSDCEAEFTEEQAKGANACPACGSQHVPQDTENDFDLRINLHDLRCLTIWASNFANEKSFSADPVLRRVRRNLPDRMSSTPLTMREEIDRLRRDPHIGPGGVQVTDSKGKEVLAPLSPQDLDDRPAVPARAVTSLNMIETILRRIHSTADAQTEYRRELASTGLKAVAMLRLPVTWTVS